MLMKTASTITVIMWFPQVGAAVVQGVTGQYVVFFHRQTCTCPHHTKGHRQCKHIALVLDELVSGLVQCECCKAYWPAPRMRQAGQGHPICQACHAGLATGLTIECDDCGFVKPSDAYGDPGHTAGGSFNGFDIDTCICAACGQRSYEEFQEDLYRAYAAEMAAENQPSGDAGQ
jgi:hypothetical protein